MTDESAAARIRAGTEAIWRRSLPRTSGQLVRIESAVAALGEGRLDEPVRADAQRQAHRIAGAAGTFGFDQASVTARELEAFFESRPSDPSGAPAAAGLVRALREALGIAASTATPPAGATVEAEPHDERGPPFPPGPDDEPLVLVVGSPDAATAPAAAQIRTRGLEVETVPPGGVDEVLGRPGLPVVAVVEMTEDEDAAQEQIIRRLDERGVRVLAVVATSTGTGARVAALRAGARLLLDVPTSVGEWSQLADTVASLAVTGESAAHRILVVDDDATLLAGVRHVLVEAEVGAVTTLSDPGQFWPELNRVEPDLLLLDIDMPGMSGLELCRLVRSHPRWQQLPVVFLSGRLDPVTVDGVYAAGADDFVGKPVLAAELRSRITHRLERAKLHRLLAETDPLTGLANRRRLEMDLARLRGISDRQSTPLCLAVVDLDRFKRINDRYGHDVGDEVLRRTAAHLREAFRGEDAVARLGGEEFVAAMLGIRRDDAVQRLDVVLTSLAATEIVVDGNPVQIAASAGVAEYRLDGADFAALYRSAAAALRVAKAAGRGLVLAAGAPPPDRHEVDVAIVEDDEVLGELLRHTLTTLGYSCELLTDGAEAVDRLTGTARPLHVKTVLLDIDLPGRDGFEVRHALAEHGVTDRSSVLVVSARSSEDDALRALRSGASDHIAKPFSVPLLVEKLHRLLSGTR
jgi:diguanylate cyclase (GGDEF)-like protein